MHIAPRLLTYFYVIFIYSFRREWSNRRHFESSISCAISATHLTRQDSPRPRHSPAQAQLSHTSDCESQGPVVTTCSACACACMCVRNGRLRTVWAPPDAAVTATSRQAAASPRSAVSIGAERWRVQVRVGARGVRSGLGMSGWGWVGRVGVGWVESGLGRSGLGPRLGPCLDTW